MRTHLLTGGAGFIGSHLTEALVARGDRVLILDDLSTGRLENVEHLLGAGGAELVHGSVVDEDLVDDCMRAADYCFRLAPPAGVKLIIDQPLESLVDGARRPDMTRLRQLVGWAPTRSVDDAIDDLIAYERGRQGAVEAVPAPGTP